IIAAPQRASARESDTTAARAAIAGAGTGGVLYLARSAVEMKQRFLFLAAAAALGMHAGGGPLLARVRLLGAFGQRVQGAAQATVGHDHVGSALEERRVVVPEGGAPR